MNPQEIERYSMRDLWDKPWFSVLTKLTYSAYLNIFVAYMQPADFYDRCLHYGTVLLHIENGRGS